jgi:hypothetical protein
MSEKEFPMKIFIPMLALVMLATQAMPAESRSVTFYADGAVFEQETTAAKGTLDIPLPAGMIEGSLRVRPASGSTIQRVDFVSVRTVSGKGEKELDALL